MNPNVDRIGYLPPIGNEQCVSAGGDVGLPRRPCVISHGDCVPGVEAVGAAIPAHGSAQRGRTALPYGQRGVALVVVVHPPHLGQSLGPGQIGDQLGEGAATLSDRCELVLVPDSHHLRPGGGGGVEQRAQVLGADHAGLVDDDQGVTIEDLGTALELTQQRIESGTLVASLLAHRHVDCTPGGSGHQNAFPGGIRRAPQRP